MNATIIQEDLTIQGNLSAKDGTISIGGTVTGDVEAKTIEVLSRGKVKGGISGDDVTISGTLEGSVTCVAETNSFHLKGSVAAARGANPEKA